VDPEEILEGEDDQPWPAMGKWVKQKVENKVGPGKIAKL
jgi:hypothetical protein